MSVRKELSESFISVKEFAGILRVNTRTVYRLIQRGLVPRPVKVGHSVRFLVSDVEACIEELKSQRLGVKT